MKTKIMFKSIFVMCVAGMLAISSCEDFITIPGPNTQLSSSIVFADDETAQSALASIYLKLSENIQGFASGSHYSVTVFEGLYADELTSYLTPASQNYNFYFNNVTPVNAIVSSAWSNCYKIIYECNRIIEGAKASTNITTTLKSQLIGEATFIRAFCHFYLVNLFGDVPLITTSDYAVSAKVSRMPVLNVYEKIISDLLDAKELLSDVYPSDGRVRINKGAATALLARAYLFIQNFEAAETQATEVINKGSQYKLQSDLDKVFLKTSEEAIWQLLPQGGLIAYTYEGSVFLLKAQPTSYALRNSLYAAFEPTDLRKTDWIDSVTSDSGLTTWYFVHKYKENHLNSTGSEYSMVLRLAEQYLIRAEARAKQNNLIGSNSSESDINAIRTRAGLPNTTAASQQELLLAVEHERRVELFTEWGHRFFDLKRTGRLDAVLDPVKPNWESTDALLPLPQNEMLLNSNLKPQNPGY